MYSCVFFVFIKGPSYDCYSICDYELVFMNCYREPVQATKVSLQCRKIDIKNFINIHTMINVTVVTVRIFWRKITSSYRLITGRILKLVKNLKGWRLMIENPMEWPWVLEERTAHLPCKLVIAKLKLPNRASKSHIYKHNT